MAELSKALHENGMKLILDISINHTGTAHKWFNRDGLYFDKSQGAYHNPGAKERGYYFFIDDNTYHGWFGNDNLPLGAVGAECPAGEFADAPTRPASCRNK